MGEAVKAVVQLADPAAAGARLENELLAHCRSELAGYKCPRSATTTASCTSGSCGSATGRGTTPWSSDRRASSVLAGGSPGRRRVLWSPGGSCDRRADPVRCGSFPLVLASLRAAGPFLTGHPQHGRLEPATPVVL
jgi:hypothetical protein